MRVNGKTIEQALRTRYGPDFCVSAVARDLGVNKADISYALAGKRPPSKRLRAALGLTPPKPRGIRVRMSVRQAKVVMRKIREMVGQDEEGPCDLLHYTDLFVRIENALERQEAAHE